MYMYVYSRVMARFIVCVKGFIKEYFNV